MRLHIFIYIREPASKMITISDTLHISYPEPAKLRMRTYMFIGV